MFLKTNLPGNASTLDALQSHHLQYLRKVLTVKRNVNFIFKNIAQSTERFRISTSLIRFANILIKMF